jgi:hypothetical protein
LGGGGGGEHPLAPEFGLPAALFVAVTEGVDEFVAALGEDAVLNREVELLA